MYAIVRTPSGAPHTFPTHHVAAAGIGSRSADRTQVERRREEAHTAVLDERKGRQPSPAAPREPGHALYDRANRWGLVLHYLDRAPSVESARAALDGQRRDPGARDRASRRERTRRYGAEPRAFGSGVHEAGPVAAGHGNGAGRGSSDLRPLRHDSPDSEPSRRPPVLLRLFVAEIPGVGRVRPRSHSISVERLDP